MKRPFSTLDRSLNEEEHQSKTSRTSLNQSTSSFHHQQRPNSPTMSTRYNHPNSTQVSSSNSTVNDSPSNNTSHSPNLPSPNRSTLEDNTIQRVHTPEITRDIVSSTTSQTVVNTTAVKQEELNHSSDKPSIPSREDVFRTIMGIDSQINTLTEQLAVVKATPVPSAPEPKIIKNKNSIQQLYYENKKKVKESHAIFDFLLHDSQLGDNPAPIDMQRIMESSVAISRNPKFQKNLERVITIDLMKRENELKSITYTANITSFDDDDDDLDERFKRNAAVLPRMLTETERKDELLSTNGFRTSGTVEYEFNDQRHYEKCWTEEEKKIYMSKFSQYPKNCKKIATFLPKKSTYDCVNYYYNNKHRPDFAKLLEKIRKSVNYQPKIITEGVPTPKTVAPQSPFGDEESSRPKRNAQKTDTDWSDADISQFMGLLGDCGKNFNAISQRMKNKTTVDCKNFYSANRSRLNLDSFVVDRRSRRPANGTPAASTRQSRKKDQQLAEQAANAEIEQKKTKKQVSIWTIAEKDSFLEHFLENGRDWTKLAELIPTKTENQIKNFFQNYKVKLGLAAPPGTKPKKKKRVSELLDQPPADLFNLAEVAHQIADKGKVDIDEIELRVDEMKDQASGQTKRSFSGTPPPPPSLLTILPTSDLNRSVLGVELLAQTALQERANPPPPPLPHTSQPSLQEVMATQQVETKRRTTKRKASNTEATGRKRQKKEVSTGQAHAHAVPQANAMAPNNFYMPNSVFIPPLSTLQGITGATSGGAFAGITDHQHADQKLPVPQKQSVPKQQPIHNQEQQNWPSYSHNSHYLLNPPVPTNQPSAFHHSNIDLTSHEMITPSSYSNIGPPKETKPQATTTQQAGGSTFGNNLPPIHAFSSVLSQLPPPDNTSTQRKPSNITDNTPRSSSIIDQLAPYSYTTQQRQQPQSTPPSNQNVSIQDLEQGKIPDFSDKAGGWMNIIPNQPSFPSVPSVFSPDPNIINTNLRPPAHSSPSFNTSSVHHEQQQSYSSYPQYQSSESHYSGFNFGNKPRSTPPPPSQAPFNPPLSLPDFSTLFSPNSNLTRQNRTPAQDQKK